MLLMHTRQLKFWSVRKPCTLMTKEGRRQVTAGFAITGISVFIITVPMQLRITGL